MGELSELLQKLQLSSSSKDNVSLQEQLKSLIEKIHAKEDLTSICQEIVKEDVLLVAKEALLSGNKETQSHAAELVAELAKVENCRISCVEVSIVPILVERMSIDDISTALQACRALGNICYEYDNGRSCVIKAGGTEQLLNLLKLAADLPEEPGNHQLRLVATGFLLNLLNLYESPEDASKDKQLLDILCLYLDKFASDEDIPTHVLLSLSCMADADVSRNVIVERNISEQLVKVLKSNKDEEVIETCLELMTNLAETEIIKTQFASGGVCEAVIEVITYHIQDPEPDLSPPIIKTATDLLVLILVGDESMNLLYAKGEGAIYKAMITWLSSEIEYLRIAGALAMGNFARNDNHCIQMVENGVAEKLLVVLKSNSAADGDIRLQHALLSALRNLCIAEKNKPIIYKQNAMETLLPMIPTIETYPVVFKLLATLRMIIDGQKEAAIEIGVSETSIKKIVSWCGVFEHPGVMGEASRILAWIIKNCGQDDAVLDCIQNTGAILPILGMLGSEHQVMINEAALALALVFAKCPVPNIDAALKGTPILATTISVLKKQDLPPEIACNVFSTLFALSRSEEFAKMNEISDLKPLVEGFSSHSNEQLKNLASKFKQSLEK